MGEELATVGDDGLPTTDMPTLYAYGKRRKEAAIVHDCRLRVSYVPSPMLKRMQLLDTPGVDANEAHDDRTAYVLAAGLANYALLVVGDFGHPLPAERALMRSLDRYAIPFSVIINSRERWCSGASGWRTDLERIRLSWEACLQTSASTAFPIAAGWSVWPCVAAWADVNEQRHRLRVRPYQMAFPCIPSDMAGLRQESDVNAVRSFVFGVTDDERRLPLLTTIGSILRLLRHDEVNAPC